MASYSTIPEEELVEQPKQRFTSIKRLVATAALVSFAVGAACAALDPGKYAEWIGAWTGRFLACHLGGSPTAKVCDRLYGDGADNICNDPNLSPIAYDKNGNTLLPSCERQ